MKKERYELFRISLIHLRSSVLIWLYLRLKKENLLTADENRLTRIYADAEKRELNNSDEAGI